MVTLYLTGTSIRLESKIAVGEHMLQKYREFKEKTPKEFCIRKTGKGCFAYLNQHYSGKDVAEQANKLDDDNGNIVECLSTMKTEDEKNLDTCMRVLRSRGYNLLSDWVYKKLAPMQIQDVEFEQEKPSDSVKQKTDPCDGCAGDRCVLSINCKLDTDAQKLIRDIQNKKWSEKDDKNWNIQDAKDGDVLATKSGNIFIFKGLLDKLNPKSPVAYCGCIDLGFCISTSNTNRWTDEAVVPATKEQRDLLFQKMKEAGYTFDFDKKELRKIENES